MVKLRYVVDIKRQHVVLLVCLEHKLQAFSVNLDSLEPSYPLKSKETQVYHLLNGRARMLNHQLAIFHHLVLLWEARRQYRGIVLC